ncbi:MAG: biotin--[acetyl-CoA-carboxylase] ligase [Deltaproteobacteria bacterium]|nr:biotin--[acetyl-CoA-carboxylase] ligase [Deltaproteobacteria bacterium]
MKTFTSESIKKLLKKETMEKTIYLFEEVGSTNDVAFELARNGVSDGTIVIADSQTKGRGRLQRKWISPSGLNLYISVIFRPTIQIKDTPLFTLITSIALAETIKNNGAEPSIRWPNDILIDRKKAAGVLTEMQPRGERVDFVVVGIGVNLNMTREIMEREMEEIAETATSIREATGYEIDRSKFTAELINELQIWYQKFQKEGRNRIIQEWTERWGAINRRVQVKFDENAVEGIASGIDENGYLVLKKDDGTYETIVAGDVILL